MRKITLFMAIILVIFSSTKLFAGVDPTTAWWNGETFELITAGTDQKTGWTNNGGAPLVMTQTITAQTNGSATGTVLGFPMASATAFTESAAQSGGRGVYKTFTNALSGYVYVKTSFYQSTSGTTYSLKNTVGTTVFEFGGNGGSSGNTLWTTTTANTVITMGTRAKWADIEFVLDLANTKLDTMNITFAGTIKSYSKATLPASTDVKSLYVTMTRSYCAAGLDNTTFGQLFPDKIKGLSGVSTLQTMSSGSVTTDFNVSAFTTAINKDYVIPKTDLDIKWKISNWGTLSPADTLLITLTKNATDSRIATLSGGSIAQSDSITLQASFGSTTLTKKVLVKALSIEGLKSSLSTEIISANALKSAITDSNPYITGLKNALQSKIDAGQAIIDNVSATIPNAATALVDIQAAQLAFSTGIIPYNSFLTYIGTVQTGYNAETRTATFFTTIKSTLNTALTNAATARGSITSTDDISSAKTTLQAAFTQFNIDVPAYSNLETQITTVVNRLAVVNPRKGDAQFLMFTTSAVDALTAAKGTADAALANSSTASQLSTAQTDLNTALTTFNNTARVAPSNLQTYKIYTYGVDGGDGGTSKNILYVDAATSLVKYTTPDNTAVANSEWTISEVSTGNYTFLNKSLGTYLNGTTVSASTMSFTLPEGFSQNNLITASTDTYFMYYIVNPSAKGLEVDLFDAATSTGVFVASSAPANRFRFTFQFEPVSGTTAAMNLTNSTIKLYSINENLVIDGIKAGEKYSIFNAIGCKIKSGIATSSKVEIKLSKGAYIINSGNNSFKFIK
jgi:hypothetical protein